MNFRHTGIVIASLLLLTACTTPASTGSDLSFRDRQLLANELNPDIIHASNALGLSLHQQLSASEKGQNVILSPLSLSTAMAMAYNGSLGETRDSIAQTFGWYGMSTDRLNNDYLKLGAILRQPGSKVRLHMANSLWLKKQWTFHDTFLHINKQYYQATAQRVDFQEPQSLKKINAWGEKQTNGNIPRLLTQPLPSETTMILLNAVSFQGGWKHEFKPEDTVEESFTLEDGTKEKVPMMLLRGSLEYRETAEAQAIRLPYGEGQMAMLLLVPAEGTDLHALHRKLWEDPTPWQARFPAATGELRLPRFKAEYSRSLRNDLKSMGVELPFDHKKADFSLVAPSPPNLFIGDILHSTYLSVTEKGTDAAAATAILMEAGSAPPKERFDVKINRPFFFVIEDRQTGAWLFLGSIYNPLP